MGLFVFLSLEVLGSLTPTHLQKGEKQQTRRHFSRDGIEDAFDDVGALPVLEGVLELSTSITLVLNLEDGDGVDVLVGDETDGALVCGVDGVVRLEILGHTAMGSMK